jgi:hypothetical protein
MRDRIPFEDAVVGIGGVHEHLDACPDGIPCDGRLDRGKVARRDSGDAVALASPSRTSGFISPCELRTHRATTAPPIGRDDFARDDLAGHSLPRCRVLPAEELRSKGVGSDQAQEEKDAAEKAADIERKLAWIHYRNRRSETSFVRSGAPGKPWLRKGDLFCDFLDFRAPGAWNREDFAPSRISVGNRDTGAGFWLVPGRAPCPDPLLLFE